LDNLDKVLNQLKDIKPLAEVNDYSFYLFLLVIILCLIILALLGYFIYKKFKKPVYHFDLNNPKQTAYKLIEIIRNNSESEEYIQKLHNYTYKKEVPSFDKNLFDEIIKKFKIKIS